MGARTAHAAMRAKEHYGLTFNKKDFKNIINIIRTNKATCLCKQSTVRKVYKLIYNKNLLKVVYHKRARKILTVLPLVLRDTLGKAGS